MKTNADFSDCETSIHIHSHLFLLCLAEKYSLCYVGMCASYCLIQWKSFFLYRISENDIIILQDDDVLENV